MFHILAVLVSLTVGAAEGPAPRSSAIEKDLVGTARAAMTGFMMKCPEAVPGHPELRRASFGCMLLPVPSVGHAQWDWGDCTSRAVEAWFWAREMTGDAEFGREMERGQQAALFSILTPDAGMPCVPELSRPDQHVYYYQMWDQGRTLRALVHWWQIEGDANRRRDLQQGIEKMTASLRSRAKHGRDSRFGEYAVYPHDSSTGDRPGDELMCMRGGQLIEPLAVYWAATGEPAVRSFLDELVAGVLSGREGEGYPDAGQRSLFTFAENGAFNGHFHVHASTALGIARLGAAMCRRNEPERGLQLLRWAKRVYDWTLSPENVNAGSTWGWFPENMATGNQLAREISEICCVADMIEFAVVLADASELDDSLAGWDELWDHVERYTINSIVPTQFFVTDAYRRALDEVARLRAAVDNGYVCFEMDDKGCFNHESAGHQTLRGEGSGSLSQAVYGVEYAGKRAFFAYGGGGPIVGKGFVVREASVRSGAALHGSVATDDGGIRIENEAACGQGPYVLRRFRVANTGKTPLPQVRLMFAVNLDSADWTQDEGRVDQRSGWATVASSRDAGAMGVAADPRASFADVGEATQILRSPSEFNWSGPRERCRGNAGVAMGWDLGSLAAGEAKSVTVTLALGADKAERERALRHEVFPDRGSQPGTTNDLATAERLAGSWYACFLPNEAAAPGPDGLPNTNGMACCSYSGPRGLYACWKPAIRDDGKSVAIRLPVNRRDRFVFETVTEGPDRVVQRIELAADRAVRVRVSDWASIEAVEVRDVADKVRTLRTEGRWLDLGQQTAGTKLTVSYPLVTRTTKERVGGSGKSIGFSTPATKRTFTATWRGNRVIAIDPPGRLLPVFPGD
jgi:hypothetical protein